MEFIRTPEDFYTSLEIALTDIDPKWESYPGLIIAGTHKPQDIEERLKVIEGARLSGTPYLGICHGHQLAIIETARNVWGIKDATSEEFGEGTHVILKRKSLSVGSHDGETYWSNYDAPVEWRLPEHFYTASYHPEYQSSITKPHPLLVSFLDHALSM